MRKSYALIAAAALAALAPAGALAQQGGPGTAGSGVGNQNVDLSLADTERNREERGFPWGLLGLIGLAGLLPRKRRDDRNHRTG